MWDIIALIGLLAIPVFIVLAVISLVKKKGKAKRNFLIAGVGFVLFVVGAINSPTSETATKNIGDETPTEETDKKEVPEKSEDVKAAEAEQKEQEEEAAAKAKAEEEAKIKAAAEQKAKEEAEQKAKEEAEAKAKEQSIPREFKAALKKAESYANTMHLSKAGIYDQLTSEYGEGFPAEAAQYAIDNIEHDWKANALKKAQSYAETMNMSDSGIYDQLVSDYGEKFTPEEAQYAIENLE
jgi:outer membrane biosynthesis protein TonB